MQYHARTVATEASNHKHRKVGGTMEPTGIFWTGPGTYKLDYEGILRSSPVMTVGCYTLRTPPDNIPQVTGMVGEKTTKDKAAAPSTELAAPQAATEGQPTASVAAPSQDVPEVAPTADPAPKANKKPRKAGGNTRAKVISEALLAGQPMTIKVLAAKLLCTDPEMTEVNARASVHFLLNFARKVGAVKRTATGTYCMIPSPISPPVLAEGEVPSKLDIVVEQLRDGQPKTMKVIQEAVAIAYPDTPPGTYYYQLGFVAMLGGAERVDRNTYRLIVLSPDAVAPQAE
jgi:hypothetical protein